MMATTHALAGVLVGLAALAVAPGAGPVVVLAAALGGVAPDVDLLGAHRKTLHFPGYNAVAALLAVAVAALAPSTTTVALAAFLAAAGLHAVSDLFGGDLELRPWELAGDRAVYEHVRGRWHPPRRWIRYDGAPEDAFLALALALPAYAALDGVAQQAVVALAAVSVVYAALRRSLVDHGRWLVRRLPPRFLRLIPETLIADLR
ncbi:metal-dependent hydrolase [Halobaculum sp. D14]|uniref:metal-dependent hydrolase n=1 Tax=Halobaculum sp. D14 TaxID=3421642 RepID=UPI003EBB3471